MRRFQHIPAGTGATYDMYVELLARPGGDPPLHTHPSAETLHVLKGASE